MLLIDADCHNGCLSADVLLPWLEPLWQDYLTRGERPGLGGLPTANRPFLHPENYLRTDLRFETEEDIYTLMREQHLDPLGIDMAILTGDNEAELSTIANPHYAAALASAYNDNLINVWLPRDARFYGSLLITPQDPQAAAREIRRLGSHPRLVQVLASHGAQMPYGHPYYRPIHEACAEMGLPFAIHLGGQGGINPAATGGGMTTYFWESHANLSQAAMTQVSSMIAHGVFERHPELKFIVIECGTAWVAPLMWRLDADWKALRKETPWLKMAPSEYCRRNIRFTTQPLEEATNREHLWAVLEAIDGGNTLLFASDYPHWDYDDPRRIDLPAAWRERIMSLNALETYTRLPRPTTMAAE